MHFVLFCFLAFIPYKHFFLSQRCQVDPSSRASTGKGAQIVVPHRTFAPQSCAPLTACSAPLREAAWQRQLRAFHQQKKGPLWTWGLGKSELGLFVSCHKALRIAIWTSARPALAITGLIVCMASPGTDMLVAALKAPPVTCHPQEVWFAVSVTPTKTDVLPDSQFAISGKS